MSDVYLLGAGFPHSINPAMPLMPALSHQVAAALEQLSGQKLDLISFAGNFEQWLSCLATSQPWLSTAKNLENRALYHRAATAVMQVVRRGRPGQCPFEQVEAHAAQVC
jgi:hypothetical protein